MRKFRIHIKYINGMTVSKLSDSVNILDEAFSTFSEENRISLSESDCRSPLISSVSNGSIRIDVILDIANMLVPILYDVIKRHFENKAQYNITISELKERWTDEENYKVCRRVLEEYAVKKSDMNLNDFINSLHLNTHSKESIRAKIQNTKWLLKEGNIINTLNVSPLSNCSKAHKEQFDVARKKLNI